LNIADGDGGYSYGQFPYESVEFLDPRDPSDANYNGSNFAKYAPIVVGDFDADGYDDFILPQQSAAGSFFVY